MYLANESQQRRNVLFMHIMIDNVFDKERISKSVTALMHLIKYNDPKLDLPLKRNKGIPQGSSISSDLFIICMDYIIKEVITIIRSELNLRYNQDYKLLSRKP